MACLHIFGYTSLLHVFHHHSAFLNNHKQSALTSALCRHIPLSKKVTFSAQTLNENKRKDKEPKRTCMFEQDKTPINRVPGKAQYMVAASQYR